LHRDVLVRRAVHMLMALAPLYYLLPERLPVLETGRWVLLICFFAVVVAFESVRLWLGFTFVGLRPHEFRSIASFVWAAAGLTIALWLFPHDIATVAIVGMAVVDPLAGELRSRHSSAVVTVAIPVAVYFAIAAPVLWYMGPHSPFFAVILGVIGATAAVGSERRKVRGVDDDFIMTVVPCLLMWVFSEL